MQPLLLLSDETSIIHVQELHSWTNLQSFKEKVWIPSSQSLRDCTSIGFIKDVLLTRCSHIWLNCIIFKKKKITYFTEAWWILRSAGGGGGSETEKSSEPLITSKIPTVFRLSQIRSQIIQIILGFRPDRQKGHQRKQIPRIDKVSHIYKTTITNIWCDRKCAFCILNQWWSSG